MARTFEFVLHFVGCVTVTLSPNQINIIIIIIIIIISYMKLKDKKIFTNVLCRTGSGPLHPLQLFFAVGFSLPLLVVELDPYLTPCVINFREFFLE